MASAVTARIIILFLLFLMLITPVALVVWALLHIKKTIRRMVGRSERTSQAISDISQTLSDLKDEVKELKQEKA